MSAPASVCLRDFLLPDEHAALLEYLYTRETDFKPSGVVKADRTRGADHDFRRSKVLFDLGLYKGIFVRRVESYFPWIMYTLQLPFFQPSRLEIHITATNDGEFFRKHRDNSYGISQTRAITFVYYLKRTPHSFENGHLILYPDRTDPAAEANPIQLLPIDNSIVFFSSQLLHEITPVRCPSGRFEDGRITINGWFHR